MPATPDTRLAELDRLAQAARDRPAQYGPDLDLGAFHTPPDYQPVSELTGLAEPLREAAERAGIEASEAGRAGSYFQRDHSVIYERVQRPYAGRVEIMSTQEALLRYDLEPYWWRAVAVDQDKYTAAAQLAQTHGYFIRVGAGQTIERPIQACLLLSENNVSQNVHNVIILEPGARADVITGCTLSQGVNEGLHIGVSEFYVQQGAQLTFTMVHNWAEGFHVRPRTTAIVEEGGVFVSNYILVRPARSIQAYPTTICRGAGAVSRYNSIILGRADSYLDLGTRIILEAPGSRGESIARTIARERAVVIARGSLVGQHDDTVGHLDCRGILLSDQAVVRAIPELHAEQAPGSHLSHEAAIGPIAEEEVEYLMARGLPRERAVSMITHGFLKLDIPELPRAVQDYVEAMLAATPAEAL